MFFRLRQLKLRAGKDWCRPPEQFNAEIIDRCDTEFLLKDMDTSHHNPFWRKYNATFGSQNIRHRAPFMHYTEESIQTRPVRGK